MADKTTITTICRLPKTGQTASYATGDDGYYQDGLDVTPRFLDNGDGTVTDRATNLMWIKDVPRLIPNANGLTAQNQILAAKGTWATLTSYTLGDLVKSGTLCYVCLTDHVSDTSFSADLSSGKWIETKFTNDATTLGVIASYKFYDSLTHISSLNYANYTDWKLPNLIELFAILDHGVTADPLTTSGINIGNSTVFSSTSCGKLTTSGYRINLSTLAITQVVKSSNYGGLSVICRVMK